MKRSFTGNRLRSIAARIDVLISLDDDATSLFANADISIDGYKSIVDQIKKIEARIFYDLEIVLAGINSLPDEAESMNEKNQVIPFIDDEEYQNHR